jgi:hypothetical protein
LLKYFVLCLEFSQGLILPNKDGKVEAAKESTAATSQTVTEVSFVRIAAWSLFDVVTAISLTSVCV